MGKSPFSYGFPMVFLWFSYGFPGRVSFMPWTSGHPRRPRAVISSCHSLQQLVPHLRHARRVGGPDLPEALLEPPAARGWEDFGGISMILMSFSWGCLSFCVFIRDFTDLYSFMIFWWGFLSFWWVFDGDFYSFRMGSWDFYRLMFFWMVGFVFMVF